MLSSKPYMVHTLHKDDSEHWHEADKSGLQKLYASFKSGDYKGYSVSRGDPVEVIAQSSPATKKLALKTIHKDGSEHWIQAGERGHARVYNLFRLGAYRASSVRRNRI